MSLQSMFISSRLSRASSDDDVHEPFRVAETESLSSSTNVGVGVGVGVWIGVLLVGLRLLDELPRPGGRPGVFRRLTTHSSWVCEHLRQASVLLSCSRMHLSF